VPSGPLAPFSVGDSAVSDVLAVLMDVRCSDPVPANAAPDTINAHASETAVIALMTCLLDTGESDKRRLRRTKNAVKALRLTATTVTTGG
jgi:hypothetical protein